MKTPPLSPPARRPKTTTTSTTTSSTRAPPKTTSTDDIGDLRERVVRALSWIISRGLEAFGAPQRAQQLLQDALGQVRDKGPAEYFDVRTDEALGSPVQTWTDAFVVAETSRALKSAR